MALAIVAPAPGKTPTKNPIIEDLIMVQKQKKNSLIFTKILPVLLMMF